ncbi:peptidase S9B dipeptidylpeptidase IV family protein [Nitzschia inconspicua]|uniref:Peptidase S9B dipeptidylpeptidase IV family protein n=1 Tax=Nitzschia inconspicua TaxID=303405 RepID=A0A9K3Q3N2_9STRA|nr:peptidase S9B dipeptidylpeptidase IV family protein [Nitzschia inconspicua]
MVGHFLQQNRKNRTGSSSTPGPSNTNATTNSNTAVNVAASSSSAASAVAYQQGGIPAPGGQAFGYYQQQQQNVGVAAPPQRYPAGSPSSYYDMVAAQYSPPQHLTAEAVAALPPPGLSGPSAIEFSPKCVSYNAKSSSTKSEASKYLVFVSTSPKTSSHHSPRRSRTQSQTTDPLTVPNSPSSHERQLYVLNLGNYQLQPLLKLPAKRRQESEQRSHSSSSLSSASSGSTGVTNSNNNSQNGSSESLSLEERLRRERQRMYSSGGITQFCWTYTQKNILRLLVPIRGSLYVQDGLDSHLRIVYDKHSMDHAVRSSKFIPTPPTSAIDPQLSPDGQLFAFCVMGEIFVGSCHECHPPIQITFGADLKEAITHGLADFVAQEEMDRYRGFWWSMDSEGIVFVRVDESKVPPYRITHHECETMSDSCSYEDHRYPFAGKANPSVRLAYIRIDTASLTRQRKKQTVISPSSPSSSNGPSNSTREAQKIAQENWNKVKWFDPPREASEYLARLDFLPDGCACAQWQNRTQNCLVLVRMNLQTGNSRTLLVERSDVWINLHHLLHVLERPIHPHECQNSGFQPPLPNPLPDGSFSFLFGSERSGFCHLYLYTFVPGINGDQAMLVRQVSGGDWVVESIAGVSLQHNAVYVTGTYDSVLEKHLYALPIIVPSEGDFDHDTRPTETEASSPGHHPNGVRRGFKHVMNALSGKAHSSSSGNSAYTGGHSKSISPNTLQTRLSSSSSGQAVRLGLNAAPLRLTGESGMHNIVMDPDCRKVVDTSSDLGRPTTVKIFEIPEGGPFAALEAASILDDNSNGEGSGSSGPSFSRSQKCEMRLLYSLFDAMRDDKSMELTAHSSASLPAPELMTFPSSDGSESLHAALYRPDARIHGPGPYPLVCAVYGGPHVQRVNRSWSQCADMRAQRLRSLGFCVVKCDNRGSSRRGIAFESAISRRLGRLEVLDQVAVVRQLCVRGIADPTRVGIYGWSYGGYLAAMCLCRAPDVFHVAVAGAPVTSWDGYDTHYTERYMGLPSENPSGYRESAVFDHVPNMRGKLLLVHGLIDENVHFRHTARLINRLIAAGKDYDLLLFPDERHSPRRLRDRIYMEQRISDYFLKHLSKPALGSATAVRTIAGL